jgi:PAS domain S-box-containing protein
MKFKDFFSRDSLGAYTALVFCVMSIVLTLVLVEVIGVTTTERLKANIGQGLAELAFLSADKMDRGMFERFRETQLLAQRPELGDPRVDPMEKRRILDAVQDTYPLYAWIGMTDTQGKVLVSTKGILEGADVSKRPWYTNAVRDKPLGDVHEALLLASLLPNTGGEPKRFVDVAFPYHDPGGKVVGILGVHLSWKWAREVERSVLRSVAQRRKVEVFIVARDGTVLMGSADMQGKKLSLASLTRAATNRNDFVVERWPDGMEYLVGFSKSKGYETYPGLGWTVLVRQSAEEAFLPAWEIQSRVLWIGIGIALLFSLIGVFVARRITQPIRALANAAERIKAGESVDIPALRSAYFEARVLSASISSVLGDLRQKEIDLRDLNADLERRVEARTAELRTALDVVRDNQMRVQTILETAQDAFIGMDLQGHITDWNGHAEYLLGWRREDALGKSLADLLVPPRYHHSYVSAMARYAETGDADFLKRRAERLVVRRDGKEIPVEMTIGLIKVNNAEFFGAFLHDISKRQEIQRMKNEFVSTVSHELRTPLTAIRGAVDLLDGDIVGDLPPEAKGLLSIASKNCTRLMRLINDILDIERIESGQMQYRFEPQGILSLVNEAVEATQPYATQFQATLMLAPEAIDATVNVDGDRIVQVIVNLLSNAAKFSPSGGQVRVNVQRMDDMVRVSVKDRGAGIAEEFRGRIFEKFGIVDASDTRKKGGTGLGLNICKRMVQAHGGAIDFRSVAGEGAEFYFDLPAVSIAAAALSAAA